MNKTNFTRVARLQMRKEGVLYLVHRNFNSFSPVNQIATVLFTAFVKSFHMSVKGVNFTRRRIRRNVVCLFLLTAVRTVKTKVLNIFVFD